MTIRRHEHACCSVGLSSEDSFIISTIMLTDVSNAVIVITWTISVGERERVVLEAVGGRGEKKALVIVVDKVRKGRRGARERDREKLTE